MTPLDALLASHEAELRALLGPLWPVHPVKVEQFGPLTKYTPGPLADGRWAMLHHITQADESAPHDHPTRMESTVLVGSYVERLYQDGQTRDVLREAGGSHIIEPDTIHRLVDLPEGEVWTLVKSGPVVRSWRHYPDLAS
jgi:hypothetical protein